MSKKTRLILLGAAALLLVFSLIWGGIIQKNDALSHLAKKLNAFGYALTGDDFYVYGEAQNTSVRALFPEEDLSDALACSLAAGFPSDLDKKGDILLLLAKVEEGVIAAYLIDGSIEFCFIETETGNVLPLGAE
ncbi:MAG: hypothetical protein E7330_01700 [Clostridiales bacterium]|nr:hypothetical protein [Clostridiales bacterium]